MRQNEMHISQILMSDLTDFLDIYKKHLEQMSGTRVLITGATGFVGRWLSSALLFASEKLNLKMELHIITRNKVKALATNRYLNSSSVTIHESSIEDSLNLDFPKFDIVFHLATPASRTTGNTDSKLVTNTIVIGTRNLIDTLVKQGFNGSIFHSSSGAVYGQKQKDENPILEFAAIDIKSQNEYGSSKLIAEKMLTEYSSKTGVRVINGRMFAFAGPHIPLDENFAVGNFINDARNSRAIEIKGNPNTQRSYLYPIDMTGWIIASMKNDYQGLLHIGSNKSFTVNELAELICQNLNKVEIKICGNHPNPTYYVPQNLKSKNILGVNENFSLQESLTRWNSWLDGSR